MAWQRGRYYVKSHRVGKRVKTDYIGTGEVAMLAAQLDALDQEQRMLERIDRRRFADFDTQYRAVDALISEAIAGVLTAHGFHQHRRQWRRRRGG